MEVAAAPALLPESRDGRKRRRVESSDAIVAAASDDDDAFREEDDAAALKRAGAELEAMTIPTSPKELAISRLSNAITASLKGALCTHIHQALRWIVAGRPTSPVPFLFAHLARESFAWFMLRILADDEYNRFAAHKCDIVFADALTSNPFASGWTQSVADAVAALLKPFACAVPTPAARSSWQALCTTHTLTPLAIAVLKDGAFNDPHIFTCTALRLLIRHTSYRGQNPRREKGEPRVQLLSMFADRLPGAELNEETIHPLIDAAEACWEEEHVPCWNAIIESWLTPCGTRMRFRDGHTEWRAGLSHRAALNAEKCELTPPPPPPIAVDNKVPRVPLPQALAWLYPPPPSQSGARVTAEEVGVYTRRHDLIIGGIQRLEAKHRSDYAAVRGILQEAGVVGSITPLQILIAAFLFSEQYMPGSGSGLPAAEPQRDAAAAVAAAPAAAAAAPIKRPAAAAAASAAAVCASASAMSDS